MCTHCRMLRLQRIIHKGQDVLPKDYLIALSLQQLEIIKECHHILRWFLDSKEWLQRWKDLRSELRGGEVGGYGEHVGKN